jgi:hypothetical protein
MRLTILLLFLSTFCYSQKGGLNFPVLSKSEAISKGYVLISNPDSLIKYAKLSNSKIYISGSFNITTRCTVSGSNVLLESDRRFILSSTFWTAPYRLCETFLITGKNVTFRGLKLKGNSDNILTLDTNIFQQAIRTAADSISIINCEIYNYDFAGIYGYRIQGLLVDNCYIHGCKRSGYGYGFWAEGTPGQTATISNNIFENNREDCDAGGQRTNLIYTGNIVENTIRSHQNGELLSGNNTTITGNYFYNCHVQYPLPSGTGTLTIQNNFFTKDTTAILISGENPMSKVVVENNFFNGENMNLPTCSLLIKQIRVNVVDMQTVSLYKTIEINFGDGSESIFINSGNVSHKFLINGTYLISVRTFDNRGIPSLWVTQKVVIGTGLNFAIKSTARFTPGAGYFQIQLLVDDTIKLKFDVATYWSWKRISREYNLKGKHKIALRLACIKDCDKDIQIWFDDFDVNGFVANSTFEAKDFWKQKLAGIAGSGTREDEKCGGKSSWHFEARGSTKKILKGAYSDVYQFITIP